MVIAEWNGKIVAQSKEVLEIDGYTYFPLGSIRAKFFEESQTRGFCPEKGRAYYLHLKVGEKFNENAAWYYPEPSEMAWMLKDMVSFWKGVKITKTEGYSDIVLPEFIRQYLS